MTDDIMYWYILWDISSADHITISAQSNHRPHTAECSDSSPLSFLVSVPETLRQQFFFSKQAAISIHHTPFNHSVSQTCLQSFLVATANIRPVIIHKISQLT